MCNVCGCEDDGHGHDHGHNHHDHSHDHDSSKIAKADRDQDFDGPSNVEGNDDFDTATAIDFPFTINDSIGANGARGGDEADVYSFTASSTGVLRINVTGQTLTYSLFNADGTPVEFGVDFGNGGVLTYAVEAGQEYFFSVTPTNNTSPQANYSVSASISGSAVADGDNQFDDATTIGLSQTVSGTIGGNDPSDWFQVTASNQGLLTVTLDQLGGDVDLAIFSSSGEQLRVSLNGGTDSESVTIAADPGETFFIQVNPFDSLSTVNYRLRTAFEAADAPTPEGNETLETATVIGFPIDIEGEVGAADTADWYRFTTEEAGNLVISLRGLGTDVDIILRDENGNEIDRSESPSDNSESIILDVEANQTFFVEIFAFETGTFSDYQLRADFSETTRDIDFPLSDGLVDPALLAFFANVRWTPGQTLGFNFNGELTPAIRAINDEFFEDVSSLVNLDFAEDPTGVFQVDIEDLEGGIAGSAFVIRPTENTVNFDPQFLNDDAFGRSLVYHEFLHALGFLHANENPEFQPEIHGLPFSLQGSTDVRTADGFSAGFYSNIPITGLLSLDMEFLIDLYGDRSGTGGNDVHIFNTTIDYFEGLHDAGGIDWIEIVSPDGQGVVLDLNFRGGFALGHDADSNNSQNTVYQTRFTVIENVRGGTGDDVITGNDADNYFIGGAGADALFGGDGSDTASYETSAAGVSVNLVSGVISGGDAEGDTLLGFENLVGSAFDDVFVGGSETNRFEGGAGDDRFAGQGGDDVFVGGEGADSFNGGMGFDTVDYSGSNRNFIINRLNGTAEGVEANGDSFVGIEQFVGGGGNDIFVGNGNTEFFVGGSGEDRVQTRGNHDTLTGGLGDDILDGGGGVDIFVYEGNDGNDQINNFTGTFDFFDVSAVATEFDEITVAADGSDTLITLPDGATIRLAGVDANTIGADQFLFSSFNRVAGNILDNDLAGTDADDVMHGGFGHDILTGGAGDDILTGGGGVDLYRYVGGDGDDTIVRFVNHFDFIDVSAVADDFDDLNITIDGRDTIVTLPDGSTITLVNTVGQIGAEDFIFNTREVVAGTIADQTLDGSDSNELLHASFGNDTINAGAGDDILIGWGGEDILNGGAGDDILNGGPRADTLDGGEGFDIADYRNSNAGVWVNLEAGTSQFNFAAGDTLISIEGIYGSRANDRLTGDGGDNLLDGQAGIDFLNGRGGNDTLTGGGGADRFIFDASFGADIITDFEDGTDIIDLSALSLAFEDLTITQSGDDVLIEDGDGNSITLEDTLLADINQDDFVFG